jgi:putative Mg2+ transporter-C (MgtC) family protein
MAGLRTNALVSTGAALFMTFSQSLSGNDLHVAAQVVTGIGFLGAGVIMRDGLTVRGLNTAATIWCSAAIGVMAGGGFALRAVAATCAVCAINLLLRPVAQKINRQPKEAMEEEFRYQIKITCREDDESHVRFIILQAVSACPLVLRSIDSEDVMGGQKVKVTADVISPNKHDSMLEQVVSRLSLERGVSAVRWEVLGSEAVA